MAAAVVGQPAVVGPDGEQIPVAFLNSEMRNYVTTQGHNKTNETQKFIREHIAEKGQPGTPAVDAIEMTHTLSEQHGGPCIPQMTKDRHNGEESMCWG